MTDKTEYELHVPPKYRADYSHWNLLLTVTIKQATCLTIGVEPGTDIHGRSVKRRFDQILELAESWAGSEVLPYTDFSCTEVLPAVWLKWLKRMGITAPDEWQPIKPKAKQAEKKIAKPDRQRAEAMRAAQIMVRQGNPPDSMQDVVIFMRNDPENYPNCCSSKIRDTSLIKAINQRGGGDPLESREYEAVLAQFQADNADKADNNRILPLVSQPKTK